LVGELTVERRLGEPAPVISEVDDSEKLSRFFGIVAVVFTADLGAVKLANI